MQARLARPPLVSVRNPSRPIPPVAGVPPAGTTRRHWSGRPVPVLHPEDVEAIHGSLRRHALTSDVERLERHHAAASGRTWRPVLVEADGAAIDDIGRLRTLPGGGISDLRMRTFGYAATFVAGPSGHVLTIDDDARLARRTGAEIDAIIRRRRGAMVGFLGSDWGVPGFVLGFPVAASTLEVASGRPGVAWVGVCIASVALVLWLSWSRQRPGTLRHAVVSADGRNASPTAPTRARMIAVAVAVVVLLAVVGVAWNA